MSDDFNVIRCFGCAAWVRKHATEAIPTGPRGDPEIWCLGCIKEVNEYTDSVTGENEPDKEDLDFDFE